MDGKTVPEHLVRQSLVQAAGVPLQISRLGVFLGDKGDGAHVVHRLHLGLEGRDLGVGIALVDVDQKLIFTF